MKYLFALGKFPPISAYEIKSYLLARGIEFSEISEFLGETPSRAKREALSRAFALYDIKDNFDAKKAIEELGGTVKIAAVFQEIETKELLTPFNKQAEKKGKAAAKKGRPAKIHTEGLENSISNIAKNYIQFRGAPKELGISLYFYTQSAAEKINWQQLIDFLAVQFKKISPEPSIVKPNETKYSEGCFIIPSESFARDYAGSNSEVIVGVGKEKSYFSVVSAIYNIEMERKRGDEMLRPLDWKFGIRQRLSKILVNLSRAKQGDILLDPFCGIGTVLKEAMLNNIHVIGRDINGNAVKFAAANMVATSKEYGKMVSFDISQGDARHIELSNASADAVATEPYLGETLRQRPKQDYANGIINELRPVYKAALAEIHRILKPGKYCVIISPLISTGRGIVRVDIKKIAHQIGFDVKAPLVEGEHEQIVKREIYVLKKV